MSRNSAIRPGWRHCYVPLTLNGVLMGRCQVHVKPTNLLDRLLGRLDRAHRGPHRIVLQRAGGRTPLTLSWSTR